MTDTVLLVGATGMLGSRVAYHLIANGDSRVRLLVRQNADQKRLDEFSSQGAELIVGDLSDSASLDRATQGVDVVVSAVQGDASVIVDGQVALAQAAKRNGARRILPSDYALDLFKATPSEHQAFDMRRMADERIADLGLEQLNVLQGGFMELFLPGNGAIDTAKGIVTFFGNGERDIEVTSVDDTARIIARVALDRDVAPGKFAVAGDRISFRRAADVIAKHTGVSIKPVSVGSEDDLRSMMAQADAGKKVMLAYLLYMTNGQTSLSNLENARYPDLRFQSFTDFVAARMPVRSDA